MQLACNAIMRFNTYGVKDALAKLSNLVTEANQALLIPLPCPFPDCNVVLRQIDFHSKHVK
jgi:hypothetical protein